MGKRYTPPGGVGGSNPAKWELVRIWMAKWELVWMAKSELGAAPQAKFFRIVHVFLKGNAFLVVEITSISKKNRLRR